MAILEGRQMPTLIKAIKLATKPILGEDAWFLKLALLMHIRQFIWPMQDNKVLQSHRACNWNQELPIYDPFRNMTSVKPGATILLKVATNNHAHEYETVRAAGHYKIYVAGDSGTHITTSDQLTDDRVIFKAPMTKYTHMVGTGDAIAKGTGDPGYNWLPLKLVDPSGNPLSAGVYNMVWTWWWPGGKDGKLDFMVPSYSTCFDITIDENAEDAGYLTDLVTKDQNAHITLIGNNTSPGAKDHSSPWPPYPNGYLTTNFDGDDPAQPPSQRSFQPFFSKHIDAVKMPEPKRQQIYPIKAWNESVLIQPINAPPGSSDDEFPLNTTIVGNITARGTDSLPVTEKLTPMTVGSGSGFGDTVFYPNASVADPYLTPNFTYVDIISTPSAMPTLFADGASMVLPGALSSSSGLSSAVASVTAVATPAHMVRRGAHVRVH